MEARLETTTGPVNIDTARVAVLVVDMQNDFAAKGGMFDRAGIDISEARRAIAPTVRTLAAARSVGIPIVYLKMAYQADLSDLGPPGSPNRERHLGFSVGAEVVAPDGRPSRVLIRDTWNTDVIDELEPHPADLVIYKHRFSGFHGTELDSVLKDRGVNWLIVAGVSTSVCVESTIRDAMFRDYSCVLLADCTAEPIGSDLPRTNHEASLLVIQALFGWVSTSEQFIRAMGKKLSPEEASAMTVNERLFTGGLLPAFDRAVRSRDPDRLRELLSEVFVAESDAEAVIRSVLETQSRATALRRSPTQRAKVTVNPFEVREAREGDAEALHLYMEDLIAERLATIFRRPAAPSVGEEIEFIRRTTIDDAGVVFVATLGERIIGSLDFHRERRLQAAHVGSFGMSVARGHRRVGVGTALLTSLMEWVRRSSLARIELQVFANNPGAIRLYEHVGFAHEGRRRRAVEVDGERIDVFLMALELGGVSRESPV